MSARYTVREEWFGTTNCFSCVKDNPDEIGDDLIVYYLYHVRNGMICTCPAGGGPKQCRHNRIVAAFKQMHRIGSGWWYNYDANTWHKPLEY